jgi:hypothetical protein
MTAFRSIHCPLIDRPATLTVESLPRILSGIGDSGTWNQFDVDCSEAQHCSRAAEDGCRDAEPIEGLTAYGHTPEGEISTEVRYSSCPGNSRPWKIPGYCYVAACLNIGTPLTGRG